MAVACVSYLCSSFDLIDDKAPEPETLARIVDSFYGLHLYASEHWLQHLLSYARDIGSSEAIPFGSPLYGLLERLTNRQQQLWKIVRHSQCAINQPPCAQDHKELLRAYLIFQEGRKRKFENSGESKSPYF